VTRKFSHVGLAFLGLALVAACTPKEPVEEAPPTEPVVVYTAYGDKTYLPTLFNEFTQDTGIIVIVRNGSVPGILDDVIGDRVTPPADMLITPSVAGVWRVAEEGELRPNYSAVVAANVPSWLRDPDKYWLALSYQKAVLVYNSEEFDAGDVSAYEDLAAEKFRRKVCLTSSEIPINRTVIAMLINKLGARNAELAVRSWVANLAQPVYANEEQLLQALSAGVCAVGMVTSGAAATISDNDMSDYKLQVHVPDETYVDIEAVGVTRHARNPDAAIALVDWMLQRDIQIRHAAQTSALPVLIEAAGDHNIVAAALGQAEAAKLAERARYR
jgi:iron(III) transport system substrate-binding protein